MQVAVHYLMSILMICKKGGRILKIQDNFFTLNLGMTAIEICRISFLRTFFFVSLDKSVLLHHRCLMSKFPEILILLRRKSFCFLSDFSRNFFLQLWFFSYIRIESFFKNLNSSHSIYFIIGRIFIQS